MRRAAPARLVVALGLALVAACGGYNWRAELRQRASIQHGCPTDRIEILSDDDNRLSRRARVDVCGEERLYHHVNNGATYVWEDETGTAQDAAPYVVRDEGV